MKLYSWINKPHVYNRTELGSNDGLQISHTSATGIYCLQFNSVDDKDLKLVVELSAKEAADVFKFITDKMT